MTSSEMFVIVVVAVLLIAIGAVAYVLTLPPATDTGSGAGGVSAGETIDTGAEAFNPLGSDVPMTNPDAGSPPSMPSLP